MKKYKTMTGVSEIRAIGIGVLAEVLLMLLLLGMYAICISNEYFSINAIGCLVVGAQFVSSLFGQMAAVKSRKDGAIRVICVVGAVLCVLQLCLALVVFDGLSVLYLYLLLATVAATASGILLSKKRKSGVKSRRKRIPHR